MQAQISLDQFNDQWLDDVRAGKPNTIQLGNRFSRKLISQWMDFDEGSEDVIFCDGSGDGGIDIAYLHRGDSEDDEQDGDTWYLVQSKYGTAFNGTSTILAEGQKVIDALSGNRRNLSSLSADLIERLSTFRNRASDRDKLILVFGTESSLTEAERRALEDVKAIGKNRLGGLFDIEAVSIETIYKRNLEEGNVALRNVVSLKARCMKTLLLLILATAAFLFLVSYQTQTTKELDSLNHREELGEKLRDQ